MRVPKAEQHMRLEAEARLKALDAPSFALGHKLQRAVPECGDVACDSPPDAVGIGVPHGVLHFLLKT